MLKQKLVSFAHWARSKRKNTIRIGGLMLALISAPIFSGCGSSSQSGYTVNLEVWGLVDESLVYADIINQYKQINPYVGEIKYRKFSADTYQQELLDALAAGQGPDIFLINNTWLPSFENKLQPAPAPLISEQDVKSNFPDVVASNFDDAGSVYAVPLSVDSMQLYYNRDMFNAAGITTPPRSWQEFDDDVRKLTVIDAVGNMQQSGAAIGTALNIDRSSDILSMLMLQGGVQLPMKRGDLAKLDQAVVGPNGNTVQAGEQALNYYTKFARLTSDGTTSNPFYAWNNRKHNSIDAFAEGSVAMMFNYSWQQQEIRRKNPKLNFSVVQVPQASPSNPVTIASYWGYAVSKNKVVTQNMATGGSASQPTVAPVSNDVRMHEAWQFLKFLTLKNFGTMRLYNGYTKNYKDFPVNFDPALNYLKKTQQPAARRDLIEAQKNDPVLGPFASGNLIAKSWYEKDPGAVEDFFNNAIESVVRGDMNAHQALALVSNRINLLQRSGGN